MDAPSTCPEQLHLVGAAVETAGYGPWSQGSSFTIPLNIPVAVTAFAYGERSVRVHPALHLEGRPGGHMVLTVSSKDGQLFSDQWVIEPIRWWTSPQATSQWTWPGIVRAPTNGGCGAGARMGWAPGRSAGRFSIGAVVSLRPAKARSKSPTAAFLDASDPSPPGSDFLLPVMAPNTLTNGLRARPIGLLPPICRRRLYLVGDGLEFLTGAVPGRRAGTLRSRLLCQLNCTDFACRCRCRRGDPTLHLEADPAATLV